MEGLSKSSREWFKRMKNIPDDGREPLDNIPEGFVYEDNPYATE